MQTHFDIPRFLNERGRFENVNTNKKELSPVFFNNPLPEKKEIHSSSMKSITCMQNVQGILLPRINFRPLFSSNGLQIKYIQNACN